MLIVDMNHHSNRDLYAEVREIRLTSPCMFQVHRQPNAVVSEPKIAPLNIKICHSKRCWAIFIVSPT